MRSKTKSKGKKKKSAYRRGEKMLIFLKRGTVFLAGIAVIAAAVFAVRLVAQQFYVRDVLVSGNYHLDGKDIIKSSKVKKGDSLLDLRFIDIDKRLRKNAWIKKVALRKQFPDTLFINLEEAEPKALLSLKKRLYIIDEDGKVLERIKGGSVPFLPVIKDINPKNERGLSEALKLVETLSEKNVFSGGESVEIGLQSYGLSMNIEGEFIKVGYGKYSEKFDRWLELEPEIRKRGMEIKYVDLRFKDSVIVKPAKPLKKERTS